MFFIKLVVLGTYILSQTVRPLDVYATGSVLMGTVQPVSIKEKNAVLVNTV